MFAPLGEIEEELGTTVQIVPAPSPAEIVGGIDGVISEALKAMEDDDQFLLMGVATADSQGNKGGKLAFLARTPGGFEAAFWLSHERGDTSVGLGLIKRWKR